VLGLDQNRWGSGRGGEGQWWGTVQVHAVEDERWSGIMCKRAWGLSDRPEAKRVWVPRAFRGRLHRYG